MKNTRDELYAQAAAICRDAGRYSPTLLQRRLNITHSCAAGLIKELEADCVLVLRSAKAGDTIPPTATAPTGTLATIPVFAIPLEQIVPSEGNQERMQAVTQESIAELAAAMLASGQLQPIVVRQIAPEQYRIVAGERRYRAALLNHWPSLEAKIKAYSSDLEEEIDRAMENLQRVDLPPLVEAHSIAILRGSGLSAEDISRKIGLCVSAVYSRLRLNNLSSEWRSELANPAGEYAHLADRLTWLEELAALPADTQAEILQQHLLRNAEGVQEVRRIISDQMRRIADAPFEDKIFPPKERCKGCDYRTDRGGLFPEFAEGKEARCTRPACWTGKCERWLVYGLEQLLREGKELALYTTKYWFNPRAIPETVRERVEDWTGYGSEDALYATREEALKPEFADPIEQEVFCIDGPQMGRVVTLWQRGERLRQEGAGSRLAQVTARQDTPLQTACKEILAQYLPEMPDGKEPPLPRPDTHDLLRLVAYYADQLPEPEESCEIGKAAALGRWDTLDETINALWRWVYGCLRDSMVSSAQCHWNNDLERSECALVFGWAGLPAEAALLLPEAAPSDSDGDDEGDDDSASDGEV